MAALVLEWQLSNFDGDLKAHKAHYIYNLAFYRKSLLNLRLDVGHSKLSNLNSRKMKFAMTLSLN